MIYENRVEDETNSRSDEVEKGNELKPKKKLFIKLLHAYKKTKVELDRGRRGNQKP